MVICDGGMTINLLASAMMNGVCCLHGIQAEEDRHQRQKDELRRTINVEYERQRLFDKECRERMRREEQLLEHIELNKRRLMAEKQRITAGPASSDKNNGGTRPALEMAPAVAPTSSVSTSASRAVETFLGAADRPDDAPQHDQSNIGLESRTQSNRCPRRVLMAKKLQLSAESRSGKDEHSSGSISMTRSRTAPVVTPANAATTTQRSTSISWYGMEDDAYRVSSRCGSGGGSGHISKRVHMWSDDMTCVSQTDTQVSSHSLFDDSDESDDDDEEDIIDTMGRF